MERERAFLLAAVVAFGALSLLVVMPYVQYVLFAGLLAYVLAPVHRRLAPRVGRRVSAGGLVAVAVVAILAPLVGVAVVVVRQGGEVVDAVQEGRIDLAAGERLFETVFGTDFGTALRPDGGDGLSTVVGTVADVAGGVADVGLGVTVLLFALYYLLADGDRLLRWTRSVTPLPAGVQDRLYADLDRLFWGVVVANVLVAVLQGVLTGVGLAVVGFPNALFWIAVTTVLALLPLVGAPIVWVPAAAYLATTGRPLAGALLAVYGFAVVSISDDYVRPVATGRGTHLSPGLLVVGIFGGVATLGFAGLFYGPIVLGFCKSLVEALAETDGSRTGVAA